MVPTVRMRDCLSRGPGSIPGVSAKNKQKNNEKRGKILRNGWNTNSTSATTRSTESILISGTLIWRKTRSCITLHILMGWRLRSAAKPFASVGKTSWWNSRLNAGRPRSWAPPKTACIQVCGVNGSILVSKTKGLCSSRGRPAKMIKHLLDRLSFN